jgi:GNAT superfamily N-acetyltransferase
MSETNRQSFIEVRPVSNASERRIFLTFPWRIYRKDPLWVPPLLPDRASRIDPQRGTFFKRGTAEFFIAWRGREPLGTICAAEDRTVNEQRRLHDCMFGFFECVPDYEVACALFERAAAWARSHGLQTLYGPFNLDYEDSYGILVEGRDRPPALLCGHTPPYYLDFVERYGFQVTRGESLAFASNLNMDAPEWQRLRRLADRLRQQGHITVRGARMDQFEKEVDTILNLLNTATAHLVDFIPWQRSALEDTLNTFRQIADPELILFAEVEGRVVGWFPAVPNLNEAFYHADGLRYPWDYLKLAWYMHRPMKSLTIKSVVVLPEYWNRGVIILLVDEMARRVEGKRYEWVDFSLTSADNPATPGILERMDAKIYKRYRVYRKQL